jgi:hypothetical protein
MQKISDEHKPAAAIANKCNKKTRTQVMSITRKHTVKII